MFFVFLLRGSFACSGGCYFDRGAEPCRDLQGDWAGVRGSAACEERGCHGGFKVRHVKELFELLEGKDDKIIDWAASGAVLVVNIDDLDENYL